MGDRTAFINIKSPVSPDTTGNGLCKAILVVEDDESIRETFQYVLELEGYQVFSAANGQEAITLLPTIPRPCIILLDLMMPVMNGLEFLEVMDKDSKLATIPVIVLTAFPEQAKIIQAKRVIKKPVDLDILLKIVKQRCG